MERKCPQCQTWNKSNNYCSKCNQLLSPEIIEKEREKVREERRNNLPPSKLDEFIKKWKNSQYMILRFTYHVLYTISFIFMAVAAFFAWLAASPNG